MVKQVVICAICGRGVMLGHSNKSVFGAAKEAEMTFFLFFCAIFSVGGSLFYSLIWKS